MANRTAGVDVFAFVGEDSGASLRKALDFVLPYLPPDGEPFPYDEETPFDHGKYIFELRVASRVWNNETYERLIPQIMGQQNYSTSIINLLWPRVFEV